MNTEQFLEELKIAYGAINKISSAIASPEGIVNNPEYIYLKDKMEVFCNTSDHVLNQLKTKAREQKLEADRIRNNNKYHNNKK